jgi:uncharacterized protein YfaS (alpha-2-macroglobulin family)
MILYALCDYLGQLPANLKDLPNVRFRCNYERPIAVPFAGRNEPALVVVSSEQLLKGHNTLTFVEGRPQVLYRLVLRYWQDGRDVPPSSHGLQVRRTFWLLDARGERQRQLKSGDAVPRGSYLESQVVVEPVELATKLRYLVVENRKPAGCEVVPATDSRFHLEGSDCLLREDRDRHVAFHHGEAPAAVTDRCVLLAETAGEFLVPPARAEMMYQTDVHGHSGTFALRVVEKEGS